MDWGAISEGDSQDEETPLWEEAGLGPPSQRWGLRKGTLGVAGHTWETAHGRGN